MLKAQSQIDLDSTDDDIRDIQQEIALLSTCTSPFVTKYKTSFVKGVKLWIVMEYLGGGSCLDLVSHDRYRSTREKNVLIFMDERRSKPGLLTKHTPPLYVASCCSVSTTYTVPARSIGTSKPPTCSCRKAAKSR